jgi:enoyl-CoA hydratase/carnithine racemase
MAESEVLIERHRGTAVVTLNAPGRRNVLSSSMVAAIASTFDSLEQDASVRCVVLTGGGHTWLLTRAVGAQHAAMACLFSEVWDAETALARGLVAAAYSGHELLPAAIALASHLDPLDQEFVRKLTATLRLAASGASHAEVMAMETSAQRWSLREPSFLAGLAEITSRVGRGR